MFVCANALLPKTRKKITNNLFIVLNLIGVVLNCARHLELGAVADFGTQNCQYTTKADARQTAVCALNGKYSSLKEINENPEGKWSKEVSAIRLY